MKKLILLPILLLYVLCNFLAAQDFDAEQQYNQAMTNAKQAFEAKQYSQAVMFYREAIKIKPDALLPKYKVEDIRTIYIEKELDLVKVEPLTTKNGKVKKKKKKEIQAEEELLTEKAKEIATVKMNEEAEKELAELKELNISVIEINEDEEVLETGDIQNIQKDREIGMDELEQKTAAKIEGKSISDSNNQITLTAREFPEMSKDLIVKVEEKELMNAEKPKPIMTKPVYTVSKPKEMTPEDKAIWVEHEKEKLAKQYPNKKTVEEIDKPGKHITRVIMNIEGKVTIYMIVKHSWGATFYFKDEIGQDLTSINQQYFNLMTDLNTYNNGNKE
ncbi:MAG: hypothetical protein JEZ09_09595 [Salinivirgaceae bacterium]|nr:hypothetical protein [Salinivirgaceae bacterium]